MSQPIVVPLLEIPRLKPAQALLAALFHVALIAVVAVLLAGCATAELARPAQGGERASVASVASARPAPRDTAPQRQALSPVLVVGSRVFAVDGPSRPVADGEALGAGPASLRIALGASVPAESVTLVGYDGTCIARATRRGTVWSPDAAFAVRELEGCADLARRATGLLVAVDGAHQARWLAPIAGEVRSLPPDRKLGERAVHLESYTLSDSPVRLVERVTERDGAPCAESLHDLVVLDEIGQPVQSHADFDLAGAVELEHKTLAVLVGWFDPQALRVVDLGAAGGVALDARLAVFADVAPNEC